MNIRRFFSKKSVFPSVLRGFFNLFYKIKKKDTIDNFECTRLIFEGKMYFREDWRGNNLPIHPIQEQVVPLSDAAALDYARSSDNHEIAVTQEMIEAVQKALRLDKRNFLNEADFALTADFFRFVFVTMYKNRHAHLARVS